MRSGTRGKENCLQSFWLHEFRLPHFVRICTVRTVMRLVFTETKFAEDRLKFWVDFWLFITARDSFGTAATLKRRSHFDSTNSDCNFFRQLTFRTIAKNYGCGNPFIMLPSKSGLRCFQFLLQLSNSVILLLDITILHV